MFYDAIPWRQAIPAYLVAEQRLQNLLCSTPPHTEDGLNRRSVHPWIWERLDLPDGFFESVYQIGLSGIFILPSASKRGPL